MDKRKHLLKGRIQWVDLLKGTAILLVIIGHTISGVPRNIIFSFHMPLFFFLSGYTYHPPVNTKEVIRRTKKNAVHLFIPAYLIRLVLWFLLAIRDNQPWTIKEYFLSGLYASGVQLTVQGIAVRAFGMMWFLVVLFFVRVLYDLLCVALRDRKYIAIPIVALLVIGLLIKRELPFSFDVTMVALFFFFAGHSFSGMPVKKNTFSMIVISGAIWIGVFCFLWFKHVHFEMASRDYPYGILSILMATSACMCLSLIAGKLSAFPKTRGFLAALGSHSMILFTIHALDGLWFPTIKRLCNDLNRLAVLPRLIIDLAIMLFIVFVSQRIKERKNGFHGSSTNDMPTKGNTDELS